MSLQILNFPNIISEEENKEIININNYLHINEYFENQELIKEIKRKILHDDSVVQKIFDYVSSNALKKGLNEVEYYSIVDFKFYENCEKYKWIKPKNLFSNFIKDIIDKFYYQIKKIFLNFEFVEEPNKKIQYLEMAYYIISNIFELSTNSSSINYSSFILIWEYYIIHICPIKFYSSILKIHLFIKKELLTYNQTRILFQIKEAIKNILNDSIQLITNEYEE